jgi:ferredoxin
MGKGVKMMRVIIDRDNCSNCGTCWEACPDIFEQDPDDSHSRIIVKLREKGNIAEGLIPPEISDCAVNAADACCAAVIQVKEE